MKAMVQPSHLLLAVPTIQFVHRLPKWVPVRPFSPGHGQHHTHTTCCENRQKGWNPDPQKDTRIHWSSPDEGWIGGASHDAASDSASVAGGRTSVLDGLLSNLVSQAYDTHYEFLGVPPDADLEGIKAAYRKLSKLYHPDTTSLPLELAAQKFLRLQKAYDVLSSTEERRFYDWGLAQEVSRQQGGGFVWPYEADRTQRASGSQTRFVSKEGESDDDYIEFSGQMLAGLFFDAFAIIVSILTIIYVAFFKH